MSDNDEVTAMRRGASCPVNRCNIQDGYGRPGPDFFTVPPYVEGQSEEERKAIQERYHQEGMERMRAYYAEKKGTELSADLSQAEWERRIYQARMRRGAPLLSGNQLMCLVGIGMGNEMPLDAERKWNNDILQACQKVVDFYEQKIASGELVDPRMFWDFMVAECIADRSEYSEQEQAEEIARFVSCVSDVERSEGAPAGVAEDAERQRAAQRSDPRNEGDAPRSPDL